MTPAKKGMGLVQCTRAFPCSANILVYAGLQGACQACEPHIQPMRDMHGWVRHPAKHGTYWTSTSITSDQQKRILDLIEQAKAKGGTP